MWKSFIILLLMGMIGPASAEVWVAQASGNMKIGEKIEFGEYAVKVHEFQEDRVSLAIYKDNNFEELFEFYEDEWRQYGDMRVEVHRIDQASALIAISEPQSRSIWNELEPAHAFWGDLVQREEYSIEIYSFDNDSVNLIIYNGTNKIAQDSFSEGTEKKYLDDIKISVANIDHTGYVDLHISRKIPLNFSGILSTQKEMYKPNEKIDCQFQLLNFGDIPINLIELSWSTQPDIQKNQIQTFTNLGPGQSIHFEYPLSAVHEIEDSNLHISIEMTLIDYSGKKYTYDFSKNVYISSSIGLTKEVTPSELEFHDESGEINNVAKVTLTAFNVGPTGNNLVIRDSLPDDIRLFNSSLLEWTLDIPPGGISNRTYFIIPDIPGGYILPPAEVQFSGKTLHSGSAQFTVHGPLILAHKSVIFLDDSLIISNSIQNTGDRAANVLVIDNLPDDIPLLEGNDNFHKVLQPKETGTFRYTIKNQPGLQVLPGASIQYQDIRGNAWYFESESITLTQDHEESGLSRGDVIMFLSFAYAALFGFVISLLGVIGSVMYIRGRDYD